MGKRHRIAIVRWEPPLVRERGETLVEVMVAVVLTGLVIVGLLGTMTAGLLSSQRLADVRNLDTAMYEAVADLEAAPYGASGYTVAPKNNVSFTVQTSQITTRLQSLTLTGTYSSFTRVQTLYKSNRP